MPFTSPRPEQKYSCKQEELYQVCLLGWDSYLENAGDFTSANTTYTLVFGQTSRTAVLTAKAMPDFQARDEAAESLLILMKEAAVECLIQWNFLETHIKKSFPKNLHKPKLEAAGSDHYSKALHNNWESVSALMESGKKFIAQNTATLTAGGMPAGFPAIFNTSRTSFETFYTQFKDAQQDAEELRDDKMNANNTIFTTLSSMFEDGQKIYRNNPAKRERFVFSKVLELVTSTPAAPLSALLSMEYEAPAGVASFQVKGTAGDRVSIAWGDGGSDELFTLTGAMDNMTHSYSVPGGVHRVDAEGNHPERITEIVVNEQGIVISAQPADNLSALEVLNFENNSITDIILPTGLTALNNVSFFQNALDVTSINNILQIINSFNTSGGTLNLSGGTNATPTGQGITAKNGLTSRGWTVTTN